jgi:integrase
MPFWRPAAHAPQTQKARGYLALHRHRCRPATTRLYKDFAEAEAERIANEAESRELQGRRDPGSVLTFAQAAIEYRKAGKAPKYLDLVEDHWRDMPVKDITRGAVEASGDHAIAERFRRLSQPGGDRPDTGRHQPRRRTGTVPAAARQTLPRAQADQGTGDVGMDRGLHGKLVAAPRGARLFHVRTGARISEALNVAWRDVDMGAGKVRIVMGKIGGEVRVAHMPPELVAALANIPSNREGDVALFPYAAYDSVRKPWDAVEARGHQAADAALLPPRLRYGAPARWRRSDHGSKARRMEVGGTVVRDLRARDG